MPAVILPTLDDPKPSVMVIRSGDPVVVGWFDDDAVIEDHALTEFFKKLGKLIALRRLLLAESPEAPAGIEQAYRQWTSAFMDQLVSGEADEYAAYTLARDGGGRTATRLVSTLERHAKRLDKIGERMFVGQITPDLYLNPGDHVSVRMNQFAAYMRANEISVSDRPGGFGDYVAATYVGVDGQPIRLPTSGLPNVLDEWITSRVIGSL